MLLPKSCQTLMATNGCEVRANYQHGLRWGAGIELQGGDGHVVAHNECRDDLCAIKCAGTTGARVERNRYETRWVGIHLFEASGTLCYRNRASDTMRAVDVEGGRDNRVEKQLVESCDTGVVIEGGAAGTVVSESWLHDCRVGLLVWGAGPATFDRVAVSEPREHAVVADARLDVAGVELGGDVWIRPA